MHFIEFTGALICNRRDLPSCANIDDVCRLAKKYNLQYLFYYFLQNDLPAPYKQAFIQQFQNNIVFMMKQELGLNKLYQALELANIRFAPLKGADLAFTVYPNPALRTFCDWDILFHPDDCEKALDFLNNDGWTPQYFSYECHGHHYHGCSKGDYHIEPHRILPGFNTVDAHELWQYIYPTAAENCCQHRLTPELNILMLIRHSKSYGYTHTAWTKLFTDLSFVIQNERPDFNKLSKLAAQWQFPDPLNVLGAFPEFFPPEFRQYIGINKAKSSEWRSLFLSQEQFSNTNATEWEMNLPDAFSYSWFSKNFITFKRRLHSAKQKRPNENTVKIIYREIRRKLIGLCRFTTRRNRKICDRHMQIKKAESDNQL